MLDTNRRASYEWQGPRPCLTLIGSVRSRMGGSPRMSGENRVGALRRTFRQEGCRPTTLVPGFSRFSGASSQNTPGSRSGSPRRGRPRGTDLGKHPPRPAYPLSRPGSYTRHGGHLDEISALRREDRHQEDGERPPGRSFQRRCRRVWRPFRGQEGWIQNKGQSRTRVFGEPRRALTRPCRHPPPRHGSAFPGRSSSRTTRRRQRRWRSRRAAHARAGRPPGRSPCAHPRRRPGVNPVAFLSLFPVARKRWMMVGRFDSTCYLDLLGERFPEDAEPAEVTGFLRDQGLSIIQSTIVFARR